MAIINSIIKYEKIIKNAHKKATKLLSENKSKLDNMARLLVERETIYQDEVDMIMDGKSAAEIIKAMEEKDGLAVENPFIKIEKAMVEKAEENIEAVENKTKEESELTDKE